jgi:hypothetical protein
MIVQAKRLPDAIVYLSLSAKPSISWARRQPRDSP